MVTIIPHLYHRANKKGLYSIAIRVTQNRKSSYVFIGQRILKKDWDEKGRRVKRSCPNSARLNLLIVQKVADINKKYITLEVEEADISAQIIHKEVLNKKKQVTFKGESEIYLSNLQNERKYNRVSSTKPLIKHFVEFLKGKDIALKKITVSLLNQYKAWLKGTRNVTDRTVMNHLVFIRSVINQAIKSNQLETKYYPFGKGKITIKFPESIKVGLSIEEIKKIENLKLSENPKLDLARDTWLFSFYFAGMRVGDVLRIKWSDINDDRLLYKMGKNNKVDSFKISEKAQKIITKYEEKGSLYVFPFLNKYKEIEDRAFIEKKIAASNIWLRKWLKRIAEKIDLNKKLTMHIARHSFGNISGDRIPIQMLQKLYRHSTITTTIGYQSSFIHKDTDDALDDVTNF